MRATGTDERSFKHGLTMMFSGGRDSSCYTDLTKITNLTYGTRAFDYIRGLKHPMNIGQRSLLELDALRIEMT